MIGMRPLLPDLEHGFPERSGFLGPLPQAAIKSFHESSDALVVHVPRANDQGPCASVKHSPSEAH